MILFAVSTTPLPHANACSPIFEMLWQEAASSKVLEKFEQPVGEKEIKWEYFSSKEFVAFRKAIREGFAEATKSPFAEPSVIRWANEVLFEPFFKSNANERGYPPGLSPKLWDTFITDAKYPVTNLREMVIAFDKNKIPVPEGIHKSVVGEATGTAIAGHFIGNDMGTINLHIQFQEFPRTDLTRIIRGIILYESFQLYAPKTYQAVAEKTFSQNPHARPRIEEFYTKTGLNQ